MRKRPPSDDYPVGYGKPPRASQFAKGQTGNPKGRPKGSKNASTVVREEANMKLTIRENGRQKTITKFRAAVRQLANAAASGERDAIRTFISVVAAAETQAPPAKSVDLDVNDLEVMAALMRRFPVQSGDDLTPTKTRVRKGRARKNPSRRKYP